MTSESYEVYTYLGHSALNSKGIITILDTVAGPNILRAALLPERSKLFPFESSN